MYTRMMLNNSRLYTFMDSQNGFSLNFFDGQKLIHDLALIHNLKGPAFAYFRDTILGALPLISFLKAGESLGIYIDSEDPYFRFKIETNFAGHTRTLLLPENFSQFPLKITGMARVTKQFPGGKSPYTSMIEFHQMESQHVMNRILEDSYQSKTEIIVSEIADQSFIMTKLPPINVNKNMSDETPSLATFLKSHRNFFHDMFEEALNDVETIVPRLEKLPMTYLASRQVNFFCPCSKEKMSETIGLMYQNRLDEIFEGDESLELKCDYCKKTYYVRREDLAMKPNTVN